MATITPDTGARYFSKIFGDNHAQPTFGYLWDSGVVWRNLNGQLITGAARPIVPADLASTSSISVSGLSLTVGAVAVTGNPQVTVSNAILATSGIIQGGNLIPIYITGLIDTRVTGNIGGSVTVSSVAITGNPGFQVTGWNTGITVNVTAPLGIIGIDTGVRTVSVVGTLTTNATIVNAVLATSGFFTPIWTGAPNVTASVSIGNIAVTGGSIQTIVTGTISATVDNTALILAIASGNSLALYSNQIASGISGQLTANLAGAAWVTGSGSQLGNLDLTHTYLSTSGVGIFSTNDAGANLYLASISGSVAAFAADNVAVTGVLTDQITGWNTGIRVRIEPVSASATSNLIPSGAYPFTGTSTFFFGQALAANPNRIMLFVQNIHTGTPLYVSLSSTAASTGAFSFILNPASIPGWGGSSFADDHYRGAVQVSGGAWQAWEI